MLRFAGKPGRRRQASLPGGLRRAARGQSRSGSSLRRRLWAGLASLRSPARTPTSSAGITVRRRPRGNRGRRCRIREALQDADTKHLLPGTFIPSQKHVPRRTLARCGAPSSDRTGISTSRIATRTVSSGTTAAAASILAGVPPPASGQAGAPGVPRGRRRAPGRQPRRQCGLCHRARNGSADHAHRIRRGRTARAGRDGFRTRWSGSTSAAARPGRFCASTPSPENRTQHRSSTTRAIFRSSLRWSG